MGQWGTIPDRQTQKTHNVEDEIQLTEAALRKGNDRKADPKIRFLGENYGKVSEVIAAYLDQPSRAKGMNFDAISIEKFTELLDIAEVDYVIDGILPTGQEKEDVTLKRVKTNKPSTKCDISEKPQLDFALTVQVIRK